jgi:Raf kinase inhibitor-like YbhB/YbcL family protein
VGLNIKDLQITSDAFEDGGPIPDRYVYDKGNTSPGLSWSGVPAGTKQLAVICHDPDAPLPHGYTHWVVYGIPADAAGIPEGQADAFTQGKTDFGEQSYGGPMPPAGHGTHHYYFWVYALDTALDAGPGLTRAELLDRIGDHILEQNRVIGTYSN